MLREIHPHPERAGALIGRFQTVEDLRLALLAFKPRYNHHWILERHKYRTPAQVRAAFKAEVAA